MIARGTPNLENMFFLKNFITTLESFVREAAASTYLDTQSIATIIDWLLKEDGNGLIKSMPPYIK